MTEQITLLQQILLPGTWLAETEAGEHELRVVEVRPDLIGLQWRVGGDRVVKTWPEFLEWVQSGTLTHRYYGVTVLTLLERAERAQNAQERTVGLKVVKLRHDHDRYVVSTEFAGQPVCRVAFDRAHDAQETYDHLATLRAIHNWEQWHATFP